MTWFFFDFFRRIQTGRILKGLFSRCTNRSLNPFCVFFPPRIVRPFWQCWASALVMSVWMCFWNAPVCATSSPRGRGQLPERFARINFGPGCGSTNRVRGAANPRGTGQMTWPAEGYFFLPDRSQVKKNLCPDLSRHLTWALRSKKTSAQVEITTIIVHLSTWAELFFIYNF